MIKGDYNLDKMEDTDFFEITNNYELPLHLAYLIVHYLKQDKMIDLTDLASSSFYSICRDVLIPYKNKSFIFQRYFNIKYPYLKNTDQRLEWFLKVKNGLSLVQKVSLLESDSSFTSMGVGKVRFEQALQRVNLEASHDNIEAKRLLEYDNEWALAVTSFIHQERGDLTAAEILLTADALSSETKTGIKRQVLSYLISRMGKIEVYFIASQVRKFHDQISRTSSLIRAFSNAFDVEYKMLERLVSMHSMVDVAELIQDNKPLLEYTRLLPFRTFRPMLAEKWAKKYKFPAFLEAKFDGIRLLVHKLGNRIQCFSRRRKNYTYKFPTLSNLRDLIPAFSIILDGEIIGVRWTATGPYYANVYELHDAIRENPNNFVLRYIVFDVLYFNGMEMVRLPYSQRRQIRSQVMNSINAAIKLKGNPTGIEIQEVETVPIYSKEQMITNYNKFLDSRYEGGIVKDPNGTYELGKRSPNWFKLKPKETLDVAITGIIPVQGAGGIRVSGLRYAIKQDEAFINMGMIRNIDQQRGSRLAELLILNGLIPQSPQMVDLSETIQTRDRFAGAHERRGFEIEPQIVITIDNLGIVKRDEKFSLRNARFLYIREDKPVDEITTYYDLYDTYMKNVRA